MISVITPCLNICKDGRLEYFEKMMASIHNQSYRDVEHIVIDGGSTDGTLDVLKKYERKGWIRLFSELKAGPYPAMNKGIMLAKGEYINFICTDDYLFDSDFLERSIKIIEHGYDFTHADRLVRSREGKPDWVKEGDEGVAFFRMPFRHETMVVKKELFDEIGLFDESYRIAADYKHALMMILSGKRGYYIPETVLFSLDGGLTSDRALCVKEVSRVIYEIYGCENGLTLDDCKTIYQRNISPELHSKILANVKDKKILDSLEICYELSNSRG